MDMLIKEVASLKMQRSSWSCDYHYYVGGTSLEFMEVSSKEFDYIGGTQKQSSF